MLTRRQVLALLTFLEDAPLCRERLELEAWLLAILSRQHAHGDAGAPLSARRSAGVA